MNETNRYTLRRNIKFARKNHGIVVHYKTNKDDIYLNIDSKMFEILQMFRAPKAKDEMLHTIKELSPSSNPEEIFNKLLNLELIVKCDHRGILIVDEKRKIKGPKFLLPIFLFALAFWGIFGIAKILIHNISLITRNPFFPSLLDYGMTYIIAVILFFFHEIGHLISVWSFTGEWPRLKISSARQFFPIPTFKTDLSITYFMDKLSSIYVFLAGTMVDIFTTWVILTLFKQTQKPFLLFVFWIMVFSILFNFIPFWKTDGYFILTIIKDQPNLMSKSKLELRKLFRKDENVDYFLAIYGILRILFNIAFYSALFYFSYKLWGIVGLKITIGIFLLFFFYYFFLHFFKHLKPSRR